MSLKSALQRSSLATLVGLIPHYLAHYVFGSPLWTEVISEWIMAHTPSHYAVAILQALGPWAKPFAMTGALATLGGAVLAVWALRGIGPVLAALALSWAFGYSSWIGQLTFWIPVIAMQMWKAPAPMLRNARREFVTSAVMTLGVVAVALESYVRDAALARHAVEPIPLFPFEPPAEKFYPALVRKAVTPIPQFYGMSKNTVDPATDPREWRLRITVNGRTLRELSYQELLALPRMERYVTLRCVSNTLQSDLMGTAAWSGFHLSQLVDRNQLPPDIMEVAIIGVDGHGDSLRPDYAFSDETLFALGMNGKTLDRVHGFPVRLLVPRYYGFKNVKWIGEIAFVNQPYFGTWPKMGYTKEPVIHIASHIDRVEKSAEGWKVGGVSFAGTRGIQKVQVRAGDGEWVDATLDARLSPFTWTRWYAVVPLGPATRLEARAMDGAGKWQEAVEGPLFPDGVTGPTIRRIV
jgi:DMSO/TMAO reductase YedYZ molybdopterin-dependent catalytic subunit